MSNVLPHCLLVRCSQRVESLVLGVNPFFLMSLSYHTDVIQQLHEFPHKPPFRSRCQQMSTTLHVILKDDPSLEGNVADEQANPSACQQLGEVSCSVFKKRLAPWTTNMYLERLDFLEKFLPQMFYCSGKQGRVASSN